MGNEVVLRYSISTFSTATYRRHNHRCKDKLISWGDDSGGGGGGSGGGGHPLLVNVTPQWWWWLATTFGLVWLG